MDTMNLDKLAAENQDLRNKLGRASTVISALRSQVQQLSQQSAQDRFKYRVREQHILARVRGLVAGLHAELLNRNAELNEQAYRYARVERDRDGLRDVLADVMIDRLCDRDGREIRDENARRASEDRENEKRTKESTDRDMGALLEGLPDGLSGSGVDARPLRDGYFQPVVREPESWPVPGTGPEPGSEPEADILRELRTGQKPDGSTGEGDNE